MRNGQDTPSPKPKRFYTNVTAEDRPNGWRILLDGRTVKTPARADLLLPSRPLAEAVAEEWRQQGDEIDPGSMPLTKLANTALDAVSANSDSVAEDILSFAARDLICYRAERPQSLTERQKLYWDPLLSWADQHYGVQLITTEGVMPVDQPADSLATLRAACKSFDAFALTALHVMTALTGSAVLALAHMSGRLTLEDSWAAAHVDEDFQIESWGEDYEAKKRRDLRFAEMRAASQFFHLSRA